jgi:hypothetical protein
MPPFEDVRRGYARPASLVGAAGKAGGHPASREAGARSVEPRRTARTAANGRIKDRQRASARRLHIPLSLPKGRGRGRLEDTERQGAWLRWATRYSLAAPQSAPGHWPMELEHAIGEERYRER